MYKKLSSQKRLILVSQFQVHKGNNQFGELHFPPWLDSSMDI